MESPSSPVGPTSAPEPVTLDDLADYLYGLANPATVARVQAELADPTSRLGRAKTRIDASPDWFRWLTLELERQAGRGRVQSTLSSPTERSLGPDEVI